MIQWLGVLIDPKLRFAAHVQSQVSKGAAAANRLACLAKTGWGVPLKQCLRLTSALIHSRVDYASVVWHRYGKSTGPPSKLQRIDHSAYRFALGVFRTHPTPFLRHDTCSASAADRLDAKTDTAIIRLLSLPDSNPAAHLVQSVFRRNRKTHRSSIHHALAHPSYICSTLTRLPEIVDARKAGLPPHAEVQGVILSSKDEMLALVNNKISSPPPSAFLAFSDGAHAQDKGAGAATAWYTPDTLHTPDRTLDVLKVRVGDAHATIPYQAELTGFELAVANARAKATPLTEFFWFFTDNQTVIRDLTEPVKAKAGMESCLRIQTGLGKLIRQHQGAKISIIWCPSKTDIDGLTAADAAAKEAMTLQQVIDAPPDPTATRASIKAKLKASTTAPPTKEVLTRLLGHFDPTKTYAALCKLTRPDETLVAQLRAGHCPLNSYLFRFKASDSPNCDVCSQVEDVDHLLTSCKKFAGLRRTLCNSARLLKVQQTRKGLLTSPEAYPDVATFGRKSYRFYRARFKRHIPVKP